jgi:phage gp45-like
MIRGIILKIVEGVIKRFTADGRSGETISDREYFQHYGFTSSPLPGAEGVIMNKGNNFIMIASDDRRYRISIVNGEVCIYTDEGDNIHFQRGNQITITSGNKLVANVANEVDITAPLIKLNGNLQVTGNISATGTMIDSTGNTNHHTHPS